MADKDSYILATASGGKALRGFSAGLSLRAAPGVHVLLPPKSVAIRGALDPQKSEIIVFKTTEQYSNFYEEMNTRGWSVAASGKQAFRFGALQLDVGAEGEKSKTEREELKRKFNATTKSAIVSECVYVPMKSFQIPRSHMILTPEVVVDASNVKTEEQARGFLAKYNSHLYSGLYHAGGMFMRQTCVRSSHAVSLFSLTRKGLEKLNVSATLDSKTSVTTSSASVKYSDEAESNSSARTESEITYEVSVETTQVWGATSANQKDEFLKKLEEDPSRWAIIDNAGVDVAQEMIGIWELMISREDLKGPGELICKRWQALVKDATAKDKWLESLYNQSIPFVASPQAAASPQSAAS